MERSNLQLASAKAQIADLTRKHDELNQEHSSVIRQLSKWESLETKGGAEVETLRKQRVELEVEVSSLQTKLEKREEQIEKLKADKKKLKESLEEWMVSLTTMSRPLSDYLATQGRSKETEDELKSTQKIVAKAERQLDKLKAALDTERARVKPLSPVKSTNVSSLDPYFVSD